MQASTFRRWVGTPSFPFIAILKLGPSSPSDGSGFRRSMVVQDQERNSAGRRACGQDEGEDGHKDRHSPAAHAEERISLAAVVDRRGLKRGTDFLADVDGKADPHDDESRRDDEQENCTTDHKLLLPPAFRPAYPWRQSA